MVLLGVLVWVVLLGEVSLFTVNDIDFGKFDVLASLSKNSFFFSCIHNSQLLLSISNTCFISLKISSILYIFPPFILVDADVDAGTVQNSTDAIGQSCIPIISMLFLFS